MVSILLKDSWIDLPSCSVKRRLILSALSGTSVLFNGSTSGGLARSSAAALEVELSRLLTPRSVRPVSSSAKDTVVVSDAMVSVMILKAGRALSTVSNESDDLIVVAMIEL